MSYAGTAEKKQTPLNYTPQTTKLGAKVQKKSFDCEPCKVSFFYVSTPKIL